MPALVICGHRSKLGGDDLSVVSLLNAAMRILELLLLLPAATLAFAEYEERIDETCLGHRSHVSRVGVVPLWYLAFSAFFASFAACLSMRILVVSGRGSPTQPELRAGVGRLFACLAFGTPLVLLALTAFGIFGVSYVHSRLKCVGHDDGSRPHWFYMMVAALTFQSLEVLIYAMCMWHWMKFELQEKIDPGTEARSEEWDRKCKCCCKYTALFCCFSFGGRGIQNEDFSSMARVLAELFGGDGIIDVVASDVIVALMAIAMKREEERRQCIERLKTEAGEDRSCLALLERATTSNAVALTEPLKSMLKVLLGRGIEDSATPSTCPREALNTMEQAARRESVFMFKGSQIGGEEKVAIRELLSAKIDADRYAIAEGARFLRYSMAINTAKGYLFANLSTNCCKLTHARCCELPKHSRQAPNGTIVGKDRTGLNEAAFMKVVGFDKSKAELHYAHFDNTVDEAVYCIVADHVWESIVLCIRGSLSLEDYVVNLHVEPEKLDELGAAYGFDGDGEYCHRGYLARAKWICEDLERHGILNGLLNKETGKHPGYVLRVTGHSLGAGTAAPVAIMLRSQHPDLRCLCYAPPGGLFSEGLATRCQSFVTSYVLNADLVPRISTRTVNRLRHEVLETIARIKVPKRQVVKMNRNRKRLNKSSFRTKDLLHDADAVPDSVFKTQLNRFEEVQAERQSTMEITLHPPGKFIHLVKTLSSPDKGIFQRGHFIIGDIFNCFTCDRFAARDNYAPRYAGMSDFDDIIISSTLISDHMVETVELAFALTAVAFGVGPSESPPPIPAERPAMTNV